MLRHQDTKTRRSKSYQVKIGGGKTCNVSAHWFNDFLKCGWIIRVKYKSARLREGVIAWVENGGLRLFNTLTSVTAWIPLNCRIIEKQAIFDLRGPRMTPEQLQREILADYCVVG